MTGEWWCEAYGPPEGDVAAAAWPRCFVHGSAGPDGVSCSVPSVCAHTMAAERRRVFGAISEGAAAGDDAMRMLAEDIGSPEDLLGGREHDQDRDGG